MLGPCRVRGGGDVVTSVLVTRLRHPLQGQRLQVLGQVRRHGRVELLLVLPDGSKSLIPAAWTDLGEEGASPENQAAPATLGSLLDLVAVTALVSALRARGDDPREQAARKSPCKEDVRAACAAESDTGTRVDATTGPDRRLPASRGHRGDQDAGEVDRQGRRRSDGRGVRR